MIVGLKSEIAVIAEDILQIKVSDESGLGGASIAITKITV